ncbi:MAG: cytochrome P450 [Acidimicrobiia bacterium]
MSDQPYVNLLDPQFYVDPWDAYRWLRDEAPVFKDPVQGLWAVSRYEDILAVEKNGHLYSSFAGSRPLQDQRADRSMINQDDPDHQTQRNIVSREFTPRAVRDHEDHVRQVVTEILDDVIERGECDAVEEIAARLPATMITELLGYPPEFWPRVRDWAAQIMYLSGQTHAEGPLLDLPPTLMETYQDWAMATIPLIEARRAEPKGDLISKWVQQEGWDNTRVLEETILVLNGGAETTRAVIGSMIRELALQPDQRRVLHDHPELLQTIAIEEFIRWVSPVLNMRRTVTEDHEFHGQELREGDELLLLYPSANRDPRAFDHPDVLDVTRPDNRHLGFGFGTHFCLGAHLARLEIRVMFEELLRRIPEWDLVDPGEPQIAAATFARAYDRIRISFTPGPREAAA